MLILRTSSEILDQIRRIKNITSDTALGEIFGVRQPTVSSWRSRNTLPYEDIIAFCANEEISTDSLFFKQITSHIDVLKKTKIGSEITPYYYEIDDLFPTRLNKELEDKGKDIDWLSTISKVDKQRIENFILNKCIPTVDELEALADALKITPKWLAERSPNKEDNWLYDFYKNANSDSPIVELIKLYLCAVDICIEKRRGLLHLSPEDKALVINTAWQVHMKEAPDSKEVNTELIEFLVTLPIFMHMKRQQPAE